MSVEDDSGRRDRKKRETQAALRQHAHRLFAEQGFAHTSIDEIAAAANVSRRTFFRYYASKDDLLRVEMTDLLPVLLETLRRRPVDEPPLMSILAGLESLIGPDGPPALAQSLAAPVSGLRGRIGLFRLLANWEGGIADTLMERWAASPGAPMLAPDVARQRAAVTAAAATSALRASVQLYRSNRPGTTLDAEQFMPILRESMSVLAAGCPSP